MTAAAVPFQEILQNPDNYSHDDFARARAEKVLAVSATLLHQRRHGDVAALLAQAESCDLEYQEEDWGKSWFEVVLDFDHSQLERFTEEVQQRVLSAMQEVSDRDNFGISALRPRAILPEVGADWRQQLTTGGKARPSNHARKVRIGQPHPKLTVCTSPMSGSGASMPFFASNNTSSRTTTPWGYSLSAQ